MNPIIDGRFARAWEAATNAYEDHVDKAPEETFLALFVACQAYYEEMTKIEESKE